jgi:DNA-binding GntR family transcriptional regulator
LRVAEALRDRILSGDLSAGSALREESLAAELEVSRNTLREALRQLTAEGLVVHQLYKGATVRTITPEEVRDIYTVRRALELHAIEDSGFAPQARFASLHAAIVAAEQAVAAGEWQVVGTASLRFHQAIVALLGSDRLNGFFQVILAQLRLAFSVAPSQAQFQKPWIERDREIYDAIAIGQRETAAGALSAYLTESERIVLDMVRAGWCSSRARPRKSTLSVTSRADRQRRSTIRSRLEANR